MKGAARDLLVLLLLLLDPDLEIVFFLLAIETRHYVLFRVRLLLQDRDGGRINLWFKSKVAVGLLRPVDSGGLRSLRKLRRVVTHAFIENSVLIGVRYLVIEPTKGIHEFINIQGRLFWVL